MLVSACQRTELTGYCSFCFKLKIFKLFFSHRNKKKMQRKKLYQTITSIWLFYCQVFINICWCLVVLFNMSTCFFTNLYGYANKFAACVCFKTLLVLQNMPEWHVFINVRISKPKGFAGKGLCMRRKHTLTLIWTAASRVCYSFGL